MSLCNLGPPLGSRPRSISSGARGPPAAWLIFRAPGSNPKPQHPTTELPTQGVLRFGVCGDGAQVDTLA